MTNRFAPKKQLLYSAPQPQNRYLITPQNHADACLSAPPPGAAGGRAEALQRQRSRDTSRSDRCRQPQQFIPASLDGGERDAPDSGGLHALGNREDARQGLPFVEHDRLVVDDAPAVTDVRIDAGGVGASARIDASVPQCLEASSDILSAEALSPSPQSAAIGMRL